MNLQTNGLCFFVVSSGDLLFYFGIPFRSSSTKLFLIIENEEKIYLSKTVQKTFVQRSIDDRFQTEGSGRESSGLRQAARFSAFRLRGGGIGLSVGTGRG